MMLQAACIVPDLGGNLSKKGIIGGIERAGKHGILPNQNAHLVTQIIEKIALVPAATPDSHHVHIGINGRLQQPAQGRRAGISGQGIFRNPVCTHRKDRPAIHNKHKTAANLIRFGHQIQPAQTNPAIDLAFVHLNQQIMQCLRTLIDRPP